MSRDAYSILKSNSENLNVCYIFTASGQFPELSRMETAEAWIDLWEALKVQPEPMVFKTSGELRSNITRFKEYVVSKVPT